MLLSLVISGITAMLVYLALHHLLVRPMRRITANMMRFRDDPENPARIIAVDRRQDEVGLAERELAGMQRDLASMLQQKSHLAALGARGVEDQPRSAQSARPRRSFSPKALQPARPAGAAFCAEADAGARARHCVLRKSTLSYGRAQEPPPDRKPVAVEALVEEVHETLA